MKHQQIRHQRETPDYDAPFKQRGMIGFKEMCHVVGGKRPISYLSKNRVSAKPIRQSQPCFSSISWGKRDDRNDRQKRNGSKNDKNTKRKGLAGD